MSKRTETSRTYWLPTGKMATNFYATPVFYQPKGSQAWKAVDVGFDKSTKAGVSAVSDKAPVAVTIRPKDSPAGFLTLDNGSHTVSFHPAAQATKAAGATSNDPTVTSQAATYFEYLPGTDLEIVPGATGAKSFFIWSSAPADPTLTYVADAPGLTLRSETDGSISYVDASGTVVGRIPHPYAVDSTPDPLTGSGRFTDKVSLTLGSDGKTITVSVDPDWLASAVYPVYVDPTSTWYNAGSTSYGDTFTASGYPSDNFANYVRPDSPYYYELWNGTTPSGSSGTSMDYLRWDLSSITGMTVVAADLYLYPYHQYYGAPTAETTYVRRVTESWAENTLTYNNRPNYTTTGTVSSGCVESTWCDFDVSNLVQLWTGGSSSNYGFQVDTIGKGSTYWKRFISAENGGSARPKLSVTWDYPASAVYPIVGSSTSDTTITWSDDYWGTQTYYHVDVATDSAFTSIVSTSGDVAGGSLDAGNCSWVVPTALTPGATYYWRVKIKGSTQSGWSAFTPAASFVYDLGNLGVQSQHADESFALGGSDTADVNVATGNLTLSHPILSLPIRGSGVDVSMTYNSQDPTDVGLGTGWRLNDFRRLTVNANGSVTFTDADGARYTFTNPATNGTVTTYTRPFALLATLRKDTSQGNPFSLTYRDLRTDAFDANGVLAASADRHANGVTYTYTSAQLTAIHDTAGSRTISLTWNGSHLASVTDWVALDANGVVQASGTGNRTTRLFYSGSTLIGWADPLNTTGSCPTGGSHLTCLSATSTSLTISRWQTVEQMTGAPAALSGASPVSRQWTISLVGGEVTAVQDPTQSAPPAGTGSEFFRIGVYDGIPGGQMWVSSGDDNLYRNVTYTFWGPPDPYARIASALQDDELSNTLGTAYAYGNANFPTLATAVTENPDALLSTPARTTTTSYAAGSLGLVAETSEPLDSTTTRLTDYTYNANNDVTQMVISTKVGSTTTVRQTNRTCYDTTCTLTGTSLDPVATIQDYVSGGQTNGDTNVRTDDTYDAYGQLLTEQRHNRTGRNTDVGTVVDDRVTQYRYDEGGPAYGLRTSQVENKVDGVVSAGGYDISPDPATGARSDLTTRYTYDSASNVVGVADARRAIETALGTSLAATDYVTTSTFDALGDQLASLLPTTPAVRGGVACSPDPSCRTSVSTYDEFGSRREQAQPGGDVSATQYDAMARSLATYEDTDGSGSSPAVQQSASTYDALGHPLTSEDQNQVANSARGYTAFWYDNLGQETEVVGGVNSTDGTTSTTQTFAYDGLGRTISDTNGDTSGSGSGTTTTYAYDLGGRITQTNDGYACSTSTYDWADRQATATEGLTPGTTCTGSGTRTLTLAYDGLGRLLSSTVTAGTGLGDVVTASTYDGAGRTLTSSSTTAGATQSSATTYSILDQTIADDHTSAAGAVTKTSYDGAGNPTDVCTWTASLTVGSCYPAGTTPWANPPATVTSSGYDASDHQISYADGATGAVVTYDPTANYAVAWEYVHLGGSSSAAERGRHYQYDGRDRVTTITDVLCSVVEHPCASGHTISTTTVDQYAYDGNDNRTMVAETANGTTTTRYYCYDAQGQLTGSGSATNCTGTAAETYSYDAAGNRLTAAVSGGASRTFTYTTSGITKGLLQSASSPSVTAAYDASGNTSQLASTTTWSFLYDSVGRMTSACQATSCSGSGFNRLDFVYDGEGNRTKITASPATGTPTVTTFQYAGGVVAKETETTGPSTVTRTFTTGPDGAIAKMALVGTGGTDGTYLVTWNGHGDAVGLSRVDPATGALTLTDTWTYDAWGTPTLAAGDPDLGFRYLYVGSADVQWDNAYRLGLLYMHARSYSPSLGRFLQPDPARADASSYRYAGNSPLTKVDPSGLVNDDGSPRWRIVYGLEHTVNQFDIATHNLTVCSLLPWGSEVCGALFGQKAGNESQPKVGDVDTADFWWNGLSGFARGRVEMIVYRLRDGHLIAVHWLVLKGSRNCAGQLARYLHGSWTAEPTRYCRYVADGGWG